MKTIKFGSIYGYYFIPRADTFIVFTPKEAFIWNDHGRGLGHWEPYSTADVAERIVDIVMVWGEKVGDL